MSVRRLITVTALTVAIAAEHDLGGACGLAPGASEGRDPDDWKSRRQHHAAVALRISCPPVHS